MRYLACAICVALLCSSAAYAQEDAVPEPGQVVASEAEATDGSDAGSEVLSVPALAPEAAEAAADAALNSLISQASDAQMVHVEANGEVVSSIVSEAAPAPLANGDDDISTIGAFSSPNPPPLPLLHRFEALTTPRESRSPRNAQDHDPGKLWPCRRLRQRR